MDDLLKDCAFCSLVRTEETDALTKLIVRVSDKGRWTRFVVGSLRAADSSGEFGVSVRKEYYLDDEGKPTFCWIFILWGDMDVAVRDIQEVRALCEPKKVINTAALDAPTHVSGKITHIRSRIVEGQDPDSRQERRTLPLKHVRTPDRNMPIHGSASLSSRGRGRGFVDWGISNSLNFTEDGISLGSKERL